VLFGREFVAQEKGGGAHKNIKEVGSNLEM